MPILIAIVCFVMTACVLIQSTPPPSAPLPKPIVYEWVGTGSPPSVKTLAQDKEACVHEAEQKVSRSEADRWQTQVNHCMRAKGWGQKAIE
jgi:hypothetical protein